jgi:heme oxygenase
MTKKTTEAAAKKPAAAKKTVARRKKVEAAQPIELSWDHVATRAYYIGLESGGDPIENWLRAERELVAA